MLFVSLSAADRRHGLSLAYEDYGFIFKMKMTEVSHPRQRKQKRQFKFIWPQKYYSARLNAAHGSRRRRGLNYQRKVCNTKTGHNELFSTKTCGSLTAKCSLHSVSQLIRGYFTGSKNSCSVSHQKVSFIEAAAYNQNKVYRESPALFVIFCFLCTAK